MLRSNLAVIIAVFTASILQSSRVFAVDAGAGIGLNPNLLLAAFAIPAFLNATFGKKMLALGVAAGSAALTQSFDLASLLILSAAGCAAILLKAALLDRTVFGLPMFIAAATPLFYAIENPRYILASWGTITLEMVYNVLIVLIIAALSLVKNYSRPYAK